MVLAVVCVVMMAAAAGKTVKINGYGERYLYNPRYAEHQLSISNVIGETTVKSGVSYDPEVTAYVCAAPAVVTCLEEELFLFGASKMIDAGEGNYVESAAIIPDGMPENYYDILWEGEVSLDQAKITLKEPGVYYVYGRYGAIDGAAEAYVVINEAPAYATTSKVLVDGVEVAFEAYNIGGNNYFKLRDVAAAITASEKAFDVTWDGENKVIDLLSGKPYTPVGGELNPGDGKDKTARVCNAEVCKNGEYIYPKAFFIGGNNYFKLRDLGELFDFDVSWDGANNCITVDTASSYTAD